MILGGRKITIQRRTRVSDGQGGWTEGWADKATERGRIRPASTSERNIGGQEQAMTTHVAYLRAGCDLKFGDRLYISETGYEVTGIRNPAGANKYWAVDLKLVQDAVAV